MLKALKHCDIEGRLRAVEAVLSSDKTPSKRFYRAQDRAPGTRRGNSKALHLTANGRNKGDAAPYSLKLLGEVADCIRASPSGGHKRGTI